MSSTHLYVHTANDGSNLLLHLPSSSLFLLGFAKVVTLDNFTALLSMQRSDCITHAIGANGQGAVALLNQGVALDSENKRGQCNDPSEPLDERNCCMFSSSQKQHSRFAMY